MISIKRSNFLALIMVVAASLTTSSAFTFTSTGVRNKHTSLGAFVTPPPPAIEQMTTTTIATPAATTTSEMNSGIQNYLSKSSITSSSIDLSLQERKPPTKEEIAAKKRNFNLIFWGGGFVAPFLATFFYFGFKFWEK